MRNAAVNIKTSGETIPNARKESKTGRAKPTIFVESRLTRHTRKAAMSPIATAIMRLPLATSSLVWQ